MRLRFSDRLTFDEILMRLRATAETRDDVDVPSRGALGRHLKAMRHELDEKVAFHLRETAPLVQWAHDYSAALIADTTSADEDARAQAFQQLAQSMLLQVMMRAAKMIQSEDPDEVAAGAAILADIPKMSRGWGAMEQANRIRQATRIEGAKEADRKADRRADRRKARVDATAPTVADKAATEAMEQAATVARQRGVSAESIAQFRKFVLGEA